MSSSGIRPPCSRPRTSSTVHHAVTPAASDEGRGGDELIGDVGREEHEPRREINALASRAKIQNGLIRIITIGGSTSTNAAGSCIRRGYRVRRKNWRGKHAALGVNTAKRKRRLGLLRIRGRQIPQIRTTGPGENHVFAGDGGDSGESVNWRRRRIPGREAITRGRSATARLLSRLATTRLAKHKAALLGVLTAPTPAT